MEHAVLGPRAKSMAGAAAFAQIASASQGELLRETIIKLDEVGRAVGLLSDEDSYRFRLDGANTRASDDEYQAAVKWLQQLEHQASEFAACEVRMVQQFLEAWRKRLLVFDALFWGAWLVAWIPVSHMAGNWSGLSYEASWFYAMRDTWYGIWPIVLAFLSGCVALHYVARHVSIGAVLKARPLPDGPRRTAVHSAFRRATHWTRSAIFVHPTSWDDAARSAILEVISNARALRAEVDAARSAKSDPTT